jgi:hypothetical protein
MRSAATDLGLKVPVERYVVAALCRPAAEGGSLPSPRCRQASPSSPVSMPRALFPGRSFHHRTEKAHAGSAGSRRPATGRGNSRTSPQRSWAGQRAGGEWHGAVALWHDGAVLSRRAAGRAFWTRRLRGPATGENEVMGTVPEYPGADRPREWLALPGGGIRPVVSVPGPGGIAELLAYSAYLERLRPICRCGRPRLGSGRTCGSAECVAELRQETGI